MKRRILVADNDVSVRRMVGRVLESENFEVQLVEAGGGEFARAVGQSPDLVVIDISLADNQGQTALEIITLLDPPVPVIIISTPLKALPAGGRIRVDAFLEKPLDPTRLLGVIRSLLGETSPGGECAETQRTVVT